MKKKKKEINYQKIVVLFLLFAMSASIFTIIIAYFR